jgi:hypothetical protein
LEKQDQARSLHHEPSSLPDFKVIQPKVGFLSLKKKNYCSLNKKRFEKVLDGLGRDCNGQQWEKFEQVKKKIKRHLKKKEKKH